MMDIKNIIKSKIWISTWIALILVFIAFPIFLSSLNYEKPRLPIGKLIKTGGDEFYDYLAKIKQEKDLLILGTSETGNVLEGHNYWNILNKDKDFTTQVHQLSGAGRCSYVYFPHLINKPELFQGMEILYYVNPTYWREGLNSFHEKYFSRYLDIELLTKINQDELDPEVYDEFISPGISIKKMFENKIDKNWENYKSLYYNNLMLLLNDSNRTQKENRFNPKFQSLAENTMDSIYNKALLDSFKSEINLEYNATESFIAHQSAFPSIDKSSDFQYNMLSAFIQTCQIKGVNITFYLGPYNQVYCKKMSPELESDYEHVISNIKQIFEKEKVNYIDGTSLGNIPGSFIDVQHTSKFGSYLTAKQIKAYYESH